MKNNINFIPIHSPNPLPFADEAATPPERKGTEAKNTQACEIYREIIRDNLEYDIMVDRYKYDKDRIDEIVDLILETVCTASIGAIMELTPYQAISKGIRSK